MTIKTKFYFLSDGGYFVDGEEEMRDLYCEETGQTYTTKEMLIINGVAKQNPLTSI